MKGFSYLSNVSTLKLDTNKCIGCGRCLEVCPHQVFSLEEGKAMITAFDACIECGACAKNSSTALFVDAQQFSVKLRSCIISPRRTNLEFIFRNQ